jgi:Nucleotidyl transferase AbiEii toxin, Type IV TA system
VPIVAFLGPAEFAGFHADLVTSLSMTGEPEQVPPLIEIDIGLPQPTYRAYPVADHIADKLCAMLETHPRQTGEVVASTRYRDLVDLATFARSVEIDGDALAVALRSESARRRLGLPDHLPDPSGPDWRAGYARSARDAPSLPDRDLDAALKTVRALLDPVLAGERSRRWNPTTLNWSP